MWWDGERCRRRLAVLPSNVFDYSIMGNGHIDMATWHPSVSLLFAMKNTHNTTSSTNHASQQVSSGRRTKSSVCAHQRETAITHNLAIFLHRISIKPPRKARSESTVHVLVVPNSPHQGQTNWPNAADLIVLFLSPFIPRIVFGWVDPVCEEQLARKEGCFEK